MFTITLDVPAILQLENTEDYRWQPVSRSSVSERRLETPSQVDRFKQNEFVGQLLAHLAQLEGVPLNASIEIRVTRGVTEINADISCFNREAVWLARAAAGAIETILRFFTREYPLSSFTIKFSQRVSLLSVGELSVS